MRFLALSIGKFNNCMPIAGLSRVRQVKGNESSLKNKRQKSVICKSERVDSTCEVYSISDAIRIINELKADWKKLKHTLLEGVKYGY